MVRKLQWNEGDRRVTKLEAYELLGLCKIRDNRDYMRQQQAPRLAVKDISSNLSIYYLIKVIENEVFTFPVVG